MTSINLYVMTGKKKKKIEKEKKSLKPNAYMPHEYKKDGTSLQTLSELKDFDNKMTSNVRVNNFF